MERGEMEAEVIAAKPTGSKRREKWNTRRNSKADHKLYKSLESTQTIPPSHT